MKWFLLNLIQMATLQFTHQGKRDTVEVNLIGFDKVEGECWQWSFKGTLATFKEDESKLPEPSIVIAIYEMTENGELSYYVDDIEKLEAMDFGEKRIEIVGVDIKK